jgi:hypothetical protein
MYIIECYIHHNVIGVFDYAMTMNAVKMNVDELAKLLLARASYLARQCRNTSGKKEMNSLNTIYSYIV